MCPKRKHSLSSYLQPKANPNLCGDSWEEKAFAEDAAGVLGGCVWPPRSYSCTFCRREFRSAQALGGHMNVHRRDRARLKLSPNTAHDLIHQDHHNPIPNPIPPWDAQYPSRICTMVFNPYSTPDSDHAFFPPPSSSISRVSLSPPPIHETRNEKNFVAPFPSPILKDHDHKKPSIYATPSWLNLVDHEKYFCVSDTNHQEKYASGDLSISLNLVVHQACPISSEGKEGEAISSKRGRIDSTTFPFFAKSNSGDSHEHVRSEVVEGSSSTSEEELDLELRLG
ncbi:hypothetical protein Vadar_016575 [Vaccinium darrowii]|uniref:Uncharacterized protein n=1 Tax=Vaccinium darrowii TaxID=229202 RepID=A0ACB7ZKN4_9ERIC|nr:hypothetical protein Vadar_016575 [Vaccinium darrowii]